ncbi:MAG: hypothetical protein SGARI_003122, partial [Bacillariaceae sp.]
MAPTTTGDFTELFLSYGVAKEGDDIVESEESAAAYAKMARLNMSLYNSKELTARIKAASACTKNYKANKAKTIIRFYHFLAAHEDPNVRRLADQIVDPEQTDLNEYRFVVLVRGVKTSAKKFLFNMCMTIFAINSTKQGGEFELNNTSTAEDIADAQYQPSSLLTFYKHIFAYASECSILFQNKHFKSYPGSYHAAIDLQFKETLKVRPDYGKKKQSGTDLNARLKIREYLEINCINIFDKTMDYSEPQPYEWLTNII